jgi:hypothetical protein
METWGVVFLGVIAAASVVQAGFLIALAVTSHRLGRRLDAMQSRLERDIAPALEGMTRVSRAAGEIADLATLQARRLDVALAEAIDRLEETTTLVQKVILRPLRPIGGIVAFLRGVQRGLDVYFRLEGSAPAVPRRRGHGEDDEHLFI